MIGLTNSLIRQQALSSGFDSLLCGGGERMLETLAGFFLIHFIGLRWHPPECEWYWPDGSQPERGCCPAEKHQLVGGAQSPGDEIMQQSGGAGPPATPRGHAGHLREWRLVTVLGDVARAATVSPQITSSHWRGVGGKIYVFWQFFPLAWFIALTS